MEPQHFFPNEVGSYSVMIVSSRKGAECLLSSFKKKKCTSQHGKKQSVFVLAFHIKCCLAGSLTFIGMVKLDYSHKPPTEQFKPGKPLSLSKRLPLPVNPLKQQQQDKWRLWLTILWLSLCLTHCLLVGGLLHSDC